MKITVHKILIKTSHLILCLLAHGMRMHSRIVTLLTIIQFSVRLKVAMGRGSWY